MSEHAPTPWTFQVEGGVETIRDADGHLVHTDENYYPSGLDTGDAKFIVASANVAHAFRNADQRDWEHLFRALPDSGHGKWKNGTIIGGPHNGKVQEPYADSLHHGEVLRLPVRRKVSGLAPRWSEQEASETAASEAVYRLHVITGPAPGSSERRGYYFVWVPNEIPDEEAVGFILERAARP